MTRSLHRNIKAVRAIDPQSLGATAAGGKTSKIIDRNGYEGLELLVALGAIAATDATVTAVVRDGDASGALAVATGSSVLGTLAMAGETSPRVSGVSEYVTRRIGYIGPHRYVQLDLVPTVSGAIQAAAIAVLGEPRDMPVASQ